MLLWRYILISNRPVLAHRDTNWTSKGNPIKNSSQVPRTDTVIIAWGDPKILTLQREKGGFGEAISFECCDGNFISTNTMDKHPALYGSFWKHNTKMKQGDEFTISFIFCKVATN